MKTLKLKQALKEMTYGQPFDVSFYTADKRRKTGGEVIELKGVTLNSIHQSANENNDNSILKAPSHYQNATRNFLLPNGKIRKASIFLLREFNNKRIVL